MPAVIVSSALMSARGVHHAGLGAYLQRAVDFEIA